MTVNPSTCVSRCFEPVTWIGLLDFKERWKTDAMICWRIIAVRLQSRLCIRVVDVHTPAPRRLCMQTPLGLVDT